MSVFQIEEKITLSSWDDITHRLCYESPIEPQPYRYVRIAAVYSFKDQSAFCGVSDCIQAHSQGFLVITSDEKETSLCEICGKRFFNVSFDKQKKTLRDQARIRKQMIRLNPVLEQVDVIKERIKNLKQESKGAIWLYLVLTSFRRTYPADLLAALKELATSKDDNAILAALAENETDTSELERVRKFQGLGIFAADIREELVGKLLKPIKDLEKLADDPGTNPSLTRYCKWADGLEEQFAFVEYLLEQGRAFFETENLERLKSIPLPEDSARLVRSLRWDRNKAAAKGR